MGLRQHIRLEMEQVVAGLSRLSGLCTCERSESSLPGTFDNEGTVETSPRELHLRASSQIRHPAWAFRVFLVTFACVMAAPVNKAQENRAASERLGENEASARVGTAETEALVRVELRGRKNWRGIKTGTVLEGCLALPIYEGREMEAPAGTQVRVTVESTEKIREVMGFWKKTGRVMTRAFNPFETSHPGEYRVNLKTAELMTPTGDTVVLNAQGLRGRSGVIIRPKAKSGKPGEESGKTEAILVMAVRPKGLHLDGANPPIEATGTEGAEHRTRAYTLTELRASTSREGDIFEVQLAEPARIEGRTVAPGTVVEGRVARSVPPRMLSRSGKMNLKLERMQIEGKDSMRVDGSLSGAESNGSARFALDDEGTLRGRKPGVWNGLIDLGYAYFVGKIADDVSEAPIRAVGGVMSDAALANAARYVGITTSVAFLITRHGRDVYVPKYAVIEIDFGERK
jgi:hypothetical protein